MRRAAAVAGLALAALGTVAGLAPAALGTAAPARAAAGVLVVGLPEREARALFARLPAAIGLGVYPDSRSARRFLEQIGTGAPPGREGVGSPLGGSPGALRRALDRAGVGVGIAAGATARGTAPAPLAAAFARPGGPPPGGEPVEALDEPVAVVVLSRADDAEALAAAAGRPTVVVGAGSRTPLLVGVLGEAGLLAGGIARRPGVVTPYDVAATVLAKAGLARPEGFVGKALRVDPRRDALEAAERLGARLERDAAFGFALTGATVALALGSLLLALALAALGAREMAPRVLQGAALAPAGYVAALLVQDGRAEARAVALVAAFFVGALFPPTRTRAFCGVALLATATAVAALAIAAALRPGGEPALSLWGDPLVSWRFFGLRNHLVAFLTGGFLVGATLVRAPLAVLAGGAVAVAVVAGAPHVGANFVGVLTLAFGAAVALLLLRDGRLRAWHLPAAIGVAVAAFALALLADTGSPASHGGLAVRRVASGGFAAALDFVRVRARLNYAEMRDFAGGFVWAALIAASLVGALAWAVRRPAPGAVADAALRAGVAGSAAAALAALALEDSGFFTATDLSFFPGLAVVLVAVERLRAARPGAPPAGA